MTCYNAEKTIARAIDSVLLFGIKDMEVIIVDDGSTDKSPEIINSYTDKRIHKFLLSHYGMMEAYAFALRQVRGDYFTFTDCDDYLAVSVKKQLNIMEEHRYRFTVTRAVTEKDGVRKYMGTPIGELRKNLTYDNLLKGKANIHAQTYMIHTKSFDRLIDFSKFMKFNTWDLPIVLQWTQTMPIHYLDFYTAYYTIDGESVTETKSRLKRFKLKYGYLKIKLYFILNYGCKLSTLFYLAYKETRNLYSIIFRRWQK